MRHLLLAIAVLAGCAEAGDPDPGSIQVMQEEQVNQDSKSDAPDTCALAAQLPSDDICSLACDPDAMKAKLIAEGNQAGACYQFYCALTEDQHVVVGVCLPP